MKTLSIFILFTFLIVTQSFAQFGDVEIIEVRNDTIIVPGVHDFGKLGKEEQPYYVCKIKNERKNELEILDVKSPSGFFVSFDDDFVKPKSNLSLIIGVDTRFVAIKGEFTEKIIIETNLTQPIVLIVKGIFSN